MPRDLITVHISASTQSPEALWLEVATNTAIQFVHSQRRKIQESLNEKRLYFASKQKCQMSVDTSFTSQFLAIKSLQLVNFIQITLNHCQLSYSSS